ncbi:MAG: hypothetical protein NT060_05120 [Candidatus Omnitrophica bacterium]|nr:hypothetical protein [Candidatus Omnitrophota bacterium]
MNKPKIKNIVIVILVSITVFSVYRYVIALKEKYALLNELAQKKEQIVMLESEKQKLTQELEKEKALGVKLVREKEELKDNLKASRKRLSKLFVDLSAIQKTMDQVTSQISLLKAENEALTERKTKLEQENETLKVKLSSAAELRKAIRELKKQARKVGVGMIQQSQSEKTLEGNQGFIIKDGLATNPAKVKIEVTPASVVKE